MRKPFRSYSYIEVTSMTATIKLKTHNVGSSKIPEKILKIIAGYTKSDF